MEQGGQLIEQLEFFVIPLQKNHKDNQRQDITDITARPGRKLDPIALVRFRQEIFPSPAVPGGTEKQVNERSDWEQIIADDEIF